MANNSKSAGTVTSASESELEAKLSEALDALYAGQAVKAKERLEAILQAATGAGQIVVARRARTAIASLARKGGHETRVVSASTEMVVQVHLNRGEAREALALLDQALASGDVAGLCYLKAVALAQLREVEAAAGSLRRALSLEPSLHHQYLLEKDFDGVRASSAFGEFERIL